MSIQSAFSGSGAPKSRHRRRFSVAQGRGPEGWTPTIWRRKARPYGESRVIRARRLAGTLLASALLTACRAGGGVFPSVPEVHGLRVTTHEENGIFLDHGFDSSVMSDGRIRKVVGWLKARAFTYQLHNITAFNVDGTMDPAKYSQLAHWIRVSRAADPHQKIVAYLSGS